MYTPKLWLPTSETKQGGSDDGIKSRCLSLRIWLILWACVRLVVSVLWTGVILIKTNIEFQYRLSHLDYPVTKQYIVEFGCVATILQIVEFGMLVTFIMAGIKKNAKLYVIYYRYCIMTLIIFAMAVSICLLLDYDDGHFFGEIYLTYHLNDMLIVDLENDAKLFVIAAIWDICLEVLLIRLVKKLINKYKYNENKLAGENV